MIFCTIGTQASFDRFVKIIDKIASELHEEVIAQVGRSHYHAKYIETKDYLTPDEFNTLLDKARIIVAHAGMGTIISALKRKKLIIIFPRIAALGEHRNEHQLATAKKMKELGYVYVANNANDLRVLLTNTELKPLHKLGECASRSLIDELHKVIG